MEDISDLFAGIAVTAVLFAMTVGVKHLCRKYTRGQSRHDDK